MNAHHKRKPAAGPGAGSQDSNFSNNNRRIGRGEFQGKGNARHAGQRPPHWRKPAGADGLAMLERLWAPQDRRRAPEQALLDAATLVVEGDLEAARRAAAYALDELDEAGDGDE